ncbi:MAG UNVERIFIED_CONTAM: RluA family pseudouridine synthase, partial [Klebsiella aerogenes]
ASRLMLHASELHFHHPVSGKAIAARQPSPF